MLIWAVTRDFQQCDILTSVDSGEPVQPPFKLIRNSKWCSASSLTLIEYSSHYGCAKTLIRLRRLLRESKGAKIRNLYNQVPYLTQDTNGKVTNSQLDTTNESQGSALSQQETTKHIWTDAHKDIANTRQNKNIKDPQKKFRLRTVSKIFYWRA